MATPRLVPARAQQPTASYVLRVDSAQLDTVDVSIHIEHAPPTLRLAMKVHPEYDARYWRYVDGWRIDSSADDARAAVTRLDSTLWRVALPGGHGVIHYRVHVQWSTDPLRLMAAIHPQYRRTDQQPGLLPLPSRLRWRTRLGASRSAARVAHRDSTQRTDSSGDVRRVGRRRVSG
ncbi:MAG TPA: hypothetical protein VGG78_06945 [Gemmatimonadaceae bacterium]